MRTLDDILTQLRAYTTCSPPPLSHPPMGVFGSYARGEQREGSDLDLLIELGDDIDLIGYAGLQIELSDALGVPVDPAEQRPCVPG